MFRAGDVERLAQEPEAATTTALSVRKKPLSILPALPAPSPIKLFLTLSEAAAYSGLHKSLLIHLVEQGELHRVPGTRYWLIARSALDA
ncbi:MAG TPA: helix-turn-helix domain-containing protein, partial [Bryobacteraceae bacterium]